MQQTRKLIVLQLALSFTGVIVVFILTGEQPIRLETTTASALLGGLICIMAQLIFNRGYKNALRHHRGALNATGFLKAIYFAQAKKLLSAVILMAACLAWLDINAPYLVGNYVFVVFVSSILNIVNFE